MVWERWLRVCPGPPTLRPPGVGWQDHHSVVGYLGVELPVTVGTADRRAPTPTPTHWALGRREPIRLRALEGGGGAKDRNPAACGAGLADPVLPSTTPHPPPLCDVSDRAHRLPPRGRCPGVRSCPSASATVFHCLPLPRCLCRRPEVLSWRIPRPGSLGIPFDGQMEPATVLCPKAWLMHSPNLLIFCHICTSHI